MVIASVENLCRRLQGMSLRTRLRGEGGREQRLPPQTRLKDDQWVRRLCGQSLVCRGRGARARSRGVKGEPGLLPQMRPKDGRRVVWLPGCGCAMLLQMSRHPDSFRGCLLRTRLWGNRVSGAIAAYEATNSCLGM